jgi:membrane protein YqaA with SNARE-associated domain
VSCLKHIFQVLLHLGPAGPLVLGVADSSFLFLPFGNDLLLIILIARNHSDAWKDVPLAAVGSTLGILLLDLVSRKGGEAGLQKMMKPKRLEYLKKKMSERAGFAVALACLAPPPFPFTPVIAAASAFQYSRRRLIIIAFALRIVRFSIVAALAMIFGHQILAIARSRPFLYTMIGFIVICVAGSAYSVAGWIRRSRRRRE